MAKETEELEQGSEEQGPPRSRASGEVSKASKAIIDASSKNKDATAIVSKGLDSGKSQERRRANQGAGPGGSLQAVQGLQEVPRQP